MQHIANGTLAHIRPAQLQAAITRSRSALCSSVYERRLNRNKAVPTTKKMHQEHHAAPAYVTKQDFIDSIPFQRISTNYNENTGIAPTPLQRHLLVLTRLFRSNKDIPDYISSGTMNRMHNRMRVVFIIVFTSIFYVFFFAFHRMMALMVHLNKQMNNFVHLKK